MSVRCPHVPPKCTTDAGCGDRSANPQTPMDRFVYDFGWGDLQDHWQNCEDCAGTGLEEADGSGPPDDCSSCDGAGRHRWGSFYHQDVGECAFCADKSVHVAEMYEGGGCYGEGWVCLPCYVDHHREACGCATWGAAERALPKRSEGST